MDVHCGWFLRLQRYDIVWKVVCFLQLVKFFHLQKIFQFDMLDGACRIINLVGGDNDFLVCLIQFF